MPLFDFTHHLTAYIVTEKQGENFSFIDKRDQILGNNYSDFDGQIRIKSVSLALPPD